jgi:hypothetical protein
MIQVSEQKTNNPNYSLGRRNMTQNQIWETEDNGGFMMTTVMGEAEVNRNNKKYTPESIKKAVDDYNQRIKTGESIAVTCLNNDYSIPLDRAYAKVIDMHVTDDNKIAAKMILLDTQSGNDIKTLLTSVNKANYSLRLEGTASKDNLEHILNVTVKEDG